MGPSLSERSPRLPVLSAYLILPLRDVIPLSLNVKLRNGRSHLLYRLPVEWGGSPYLLGIHKTLALADLNGRRGLKICQGDCLNFFVRDGLETSLEYHSGCPLSNMMAMDKSTEVQ